MGSNFFRNWRANDAREFAKLRGFTLKNMKGDDEYWSNSNLNAVFRIPSRNEVIPLPTMMSMVQKSKIPKKEWLEWIKNR